MEEKKSENYINKTPRKMARIAWPKAKYGAILAVIIIGIFPNIFLDPMRMSIEQIIINYEFANGK